MAKATVIRDTVHGDVRLSADEVRLLDTRELQRLRGIHQLGLAFLVFPGARHSRFEHSIGTCHMAGRILDAVARRAGEGPCRAPSDDERRIVRAAALVHDVTHIPFGHNIEDQTGLLPRHDEPERFREVLDPGTELGAELQRQGLLDAVLGALGAGPAPGAPFLAQAISDTICSDLMDYLERDAAYTGLNLRYDPRVADYFRIEAASGRLYVDCAKQGLLREDVVSEILRMLQARYFFSERVYYHHAKIAAGAMVARAVEILLEEGRLDASELMRLGDYELLGLLQARAPRGAAGRFVGEIAARLARRRLFKRVSVFAYDGNESVQEALVARFFDPAGRAARRAFEQDLERRFRGRFGRDVQVVFYCPGRRMQLKGADTLVKMPGTAALAPLSHFADRLPALAALERAYLRLWKAYVFTSAVEPEERRFLQGAVREALPEAEDAYRIG